MNIRYTLSVLLITLAFAYGTFSFLKWRDRDLWQASERAIETKQGASPEEQNELDTLRAEAEERLRSATTTKEDSKQLETLRLEAEKRLETETTAPQQTTTQTAKTEQTTQEQTLDQRREEAMQRLLNQ